MVLGLEGTAVDQRYSTLMITRHYDDNNHDDNYNDNEDNDDDSDNNYGLRS